jgi:hypothetical protein
MHNVERNGEKQNGKYALAYENNIKRKAKLTFFLRSSVNILYECEHYKNRN